jgi:predicted naringenin-chalcone synthase
VFNSKDQKTSHGSPLEDRMNYFSEKMPVVFGALYADALASPPDDIIHVSCSGYVSPSPAQRFVSKQGWLTTNVTHSYHMGCYGAFPPVNMAVGFLASSHHVLSSAKKKYDIVHTELLSSHADFSAQKPSDIVVMTLFADGFAKYSAYTESAFLDQKNIPSTDSRPKRGLKVRSSHNEIFPDSLEEMTWIPKSHVFEMYLSKNVPLLIRDRIVAFISELTRMAGVDFETEKKNILFAIHPGGPKILTHIRDCLGIGEHQLKWSRDVLYHHGNMSSATVPHIWKSMVEDEAITAGTIVVSVAFGPGLTATGLVFEVV